MTKVEITDGVLPEGRRELIDITDWPWSVKRFLPDAVEKFMDREDHRGVGPYARAYVEKSLFHIIVVDPEIESGRCKVCGEELPPPKPRRKTCSDACRKKLERERKNRAW